MLKELGAEYIDADEISREIVEPRSEAWREIKKTFGEEVINPDETINREKLAKIVFNDREKLETLNQIMHPRIGHEVYQEIQKHRDMGTKFLVLDIPLLIEVKFDKFLNYLVVVASSKKNQIKRLCEKGMSKDEAEKRISAQLPLDDKIKMADYVVENNESLEELKSKVKTLWEKIKEKEFEDTFF